MKTHTQVAPPSDGSERAPLVKPGGGVVASPRPCPVCKTPLRGRQESCSGKCRAAKSRQERARELTARDRRVRERLRAALDLVHAAWQELGRE